MNRQQFDDTTAAIARAGRALDGVDLNAYRATIGRDNTLGPVLDTTAWRDRVRVTEALDAAAEAAASFRRAWERAEELGLAEIVREGERRLAAAPPAPPARPAAKPTHALACPECGNRDDLQVRMIVDVPAVLVEDVGGGFVDGKLDDVDAIEQPEVDGEPGVDDGVWCPRCESWSHRSECVHPVDDAGNPEIPSLGERPERELTDEGGRR